MKLWHEVHKEKSQLYNIQTYFKDNSFINFWLMLYLKLSEFQTWRTFIVLINYEDLKDVDPVDLLKVRFFFVSREKMKLSKIRCVKWVFRCFRTVQFCCWWGPVYIVLGWITLPRFCCWWFELFAFLVRDWGGGCHSIIRFGGGIFISRNW